MRRTQNQRHFFFLRWPDLGIVGPAPSLLNFKKIDRGPCEIEDLQEREETPQIEKKKN